MKKLSKCRGFDWDAGNYDKNWIRHRVAAWECEQVFFNRPLIVAEDDRHSKDEARFYALGITDLARVLFVVFTIRRDKIRIVSARDANRRERRRYESYEE